MSSIPDREWEIWHSSRARSMMPVRGAFAIEVVSAGMVPQALEFLRENNGVSSNGKHASSFIQGTSSAGIRFPNCLGYAQSFDTEDELFDPSTLKSVLDATHELEIHLDLAFTIGQVQYVADVGSFAEVPLLVARRLSLVRGVGFEVSERGTALQSLEAGDFEITPILKVAQAHYSTGTALMGLEDQMDGFLDGAFMSFYLAVEKLIRTHKENNVGSNGLKHFGTRFTDDDGAIISHLMRVRNSFFAHSASRSNHESLPAIVLGRQVLVARWAARRLIELELNRTLLHREVRLYSANTSHEFRGDPTQLARGELFSCGPIAR